jgi:hypothetical protein
VLPLSRRRALNAEENPMRSDVARGWAGVLAAGLIAGTSLVHGHAPAGLRDLGLWRLDAMVMLALGIGAIALRRGDEPEHVAAVALIAAAASLSVTGAIEAGRAENLPAPADGLVIQMWLLVILVWLGLYANRGWTLVLGALQMLAFAGHLAQAFGPVRVRDAFAALGAVVPLLQFAVVGMGTIAHARRVRRIGRYPAWRAPVARSRQAGRGRAAPGGP